MIRALLFVLGLAAGYAMHLATAPAWPAVVVCESGEEQPGNGFDLEWSAICRADHVYGRAVRVEMID